MNILDEIVSNTKSKLEYRKIQKASMKYTQKSVIKLLKKVSSKNL